MLALRDFARAPGNRIIEIRRDGRGHGMHRFYGNDIYAVFLGLQYGRCAGERTARHFSESSFLRADNFSQNGFVVEYYASKRKWRMLSAAYDVLDRWTLFLGLG